MDFLKRCESYAYIRYFCDTKNKLILPWHIDINIKSIGPWGRLQRAEGGEAPVEDEANNYHQTYAQYAAATYTSLKIINASAT